MIFHQIIKKTSTHPKKLFLLDGFGALLSAFLLGVLLVKLESTIGMPPNILYKLAIIAGILSIYSFLNYWIDNRNWRPYLKGIAIANLVYCCITLGLVMDCYEKLTALGVFYFILEIVIIISLATIELKTSATIISNKV